jgi:PAS domain S-box-containing protein
MTSHPSQAPPDRALHVLLVEDDRERYLMIRDLLEKVRPGRFRLDWISGYQAGLTAIERQRPDVCLVDQDLGERSGLELLREGGAQRGLLPFIVLGAGVDPGAAQRALAAGAADHLGRGELDAITLERSIRHALERARSGAALQARERQLEAVFDCALDGMVIADDEALYQDANQAALDLFGVTREELLRKRVFDFSPGGNPDLFRQSWKLFLSEGRQQGEFPIARPDGQLRMVEYNARAHILPGRHLSILRDVTERRRTEEVRSRLAAIVESADDAIAGITLEGLIDYWSPAAERVYGYRPDEIMGRSIVLLTAPERAGELEGILALVRRGEPIRNLEAVHQTRAGSRFHALLTVSPTRMQGNVVGASVIARDITERKELEARLIHSDRMASVGGLAAAIIHEINNPLTALLANLDHLTLERPELAAAAEDARLQAERIRQIVRDLKLFARPLDDSRRAVSLREVLETSVRMAWNEIRHRARLVRDYGELPLIEGSAGRLAQVFVTLLVNAAHAIREGDAASNEIKVVTRLLDDRAVVDVTDTGREIDGEPRARILEPCSPTRRPGVGAGLHLSMCERIVQEHGGAVEVRCAPRAGTTVRVTLPRGRPQVPAAPPPAPPVTVEGRGRILVVDDEPTIGLAFQRILGGEYLVTTVTRAEEALDRLVAGERYDLIICDVMMPEMTGMDLYQALARVSPRHAAAMIFLTGGAFTAGAESFLAGVPNPRLEKPFDTRGLRGFINERLRGTQR